VIFTKGRNGRATLGGTRPWEWAGRPSDLRGRHRVEPAGTVIPKEIHAPQRRVRPAAVDVSARNGAGPFGPVMVLGHGEHKTLRITTPLVTVSPLHDVPAVIFPAPALRRLQVDLFPLVLPYVGNVKISRFTIEGKAPRVAKPQRPYFRPGLGVIDKGVVRRDGVRLPSIHVNPQDFA